MSIPFANERNISLFALGRKPPKRLECFPVMQIASLVRTSRRSGVSMWYLGMDHSSSVVAALPCKRSGCSQISPSDLNCGCVVVQVFAGSNIKFGGIGLCLILVFILFSCWRVEVDAQHFAKLVTGAQQICPPGAVH